MDSIFSDLPLYVYLVLSAIIILPLFVPRIKELLENGNPKLREKQKIKGKYTLPILYSRKLYKTAAVYFLIFLVVLLAMPNAFESVKATVLSILMAVLMCSFLLFLDTFRVNISVHLREGEIMINRTLISTASIKTAELWDDLILFRMSTGNEEKFWIRYRVKRYPQALEMMRAIEEYCQKNNISVDNHFGRQTDKEERFNPASQMT